MPKKIEVNPKTPARIKELLRETGLKQKELASIIFCSPQHISRIVQGHRGLSLETAEAIAKHYSVRVEYLMGIDDYKTEGAIMKAQLEVERQMFSQCLTALKNIISVSFCGDSSFEITCEEGRWKIKKDGKIGCFLSHDQLEVLVSGFLIHSKQYINDFMNLLSLN